MQLTHVPPMMYRLWSIQQQIRWCNFALSHKATPEVRQLRLQKRDLLRKEEADVMVQIAERAQLIKILIANEISFTTIDNKIHLI